ncbi:hypothetical protein CcaverHIS002_0508340 [Cutaneotrichosporon cavernicola]|uniref:Peptidase M20 domain-containing protein 2 n=1 Tax=Cutaneotrichosporon cavernicola TaxID=279322 RepID=A0AA48L7A7_9TREE|nr:uncharacterized protein CcaverHIS019_0508910 [Cutaneotrichosporon cavernicola]BEI85433.1 hypothetical protein CcaverHIS002_0508340 [Cutaneotrichosporon cavernicola]BEI93263.1 hypothetical protein CcaverHIS019_0508910 [Cutaneotrichosporon cavernicola]BEJ01041.1 hypothetical protein CcaverHIS631_0508980 [Cutaneotrichosporon cavernicola]BEJ08808.1 hypothetical protein CcaverHIS641_0509020 [Cutaneotrichosporon cavernicola]
MLPNKAIAQTVTTLRGISPSSAHFDDETKDAVFGAIDGANAAMWELNKTIHENPELPFEEYKARAALVKALCKLGFTVTNPSSLPTAFVATYSHGRGGRVFGFDAEYDALPDVGHACGHNLIAVAAVAAAVGLKAALKARNIPGTVKVVGSPAEEGGGGKIILLNEGVYESLDACAMAHPEGGMGATYDGNAYVGGPASLARSGFEVEFHGRGAHAGAAPWLGINALDAAVQGYTAVSMLRQQLEPSMRVHGIIQGSEKWAQNIIPSYAKVAYSSRALTVKQTLELRDKTIACFAAAAKATGCKHVVTAPETDVYAELRNNRLLADAYADLMGHDFKQVIARSGMTTASTDFGNVTYALPAIHPGFVIVSDTVNHTAGFTAAAAKKDAHRRAMVVAKGLAMTGAKFLEDDRFAKEVKKEFERFRREEGRDMV